MDAVGTGHGDALYCTTGPFLTDHLEELLPFQNHMQSLICDVLKKYELGKSTAAVDSTNHIITGHRKF